MKTSSSRLIGAALLSGLCIAASSDESPTKPVEPLTIHPKIFSLVDCWESDSERPVVTEINLDAVAGNGNEFNDAGLTTEGEWRRASAENSGFMRYRVLSNKGSHYEVEYQENGGGSLTSACTIGFSILKRDLKRDGKMVSARVLRVESIAAK